MKSRRLVSGVGFFALLAALGCAPRPSHLYAPHEAGLTLAYEDPSLPPEKRRECRYQVRVESTDVQASNTYVHLVYGSLKGEKEVHFCLKQGSVIQLPGKPLSPSVPQGQTVPSPNMAGLVRVCEGFPWTQTTWDSQGMRFAILGRAQANLPGLRLPEGACTGVWVEVRPDKGLPCRTFLLPDIGEAETMTYRDGKWVTVSRLVSRGFTDGPARR